MALLYKDLVQDFGSGPQIPDLALYNTIIDPSVQQQVLDRSKLGIEKFKETPLVAEVRRRSKQDLYWLSRYFTWGTNSEGIGKDISFNLINEKVHRVLCDMYVKKDDSKSIADQDRVCKQRMILYPRGSFKSTIDIVDAVQWILNFPEIRILMFSATIKPMAIGFVDAVKGHFVLKTLQPSLMNLFFPEYCVDEKHLGPAEKFTCPLWEAKQSGRVEPTVLASSAESALAGPHFEVAKADDPVSNENSGSTEQCEKVNKNFRLSMNTLLPFGYLDLNGTRYSDADLFGVELDKDVGEIETISGLADEADPRPWTLTINKTTGAKTLIGRGWQLRPDAQKAVVEEQVKEEDLTEKDYYILFPEWLGFSVLKAKQRDDPNFEGQINQNPRPKSRILFDRNMLLRRTVNFTQVPMSGPTCVIWDFAFSKKKGRDYSTAAVGILNDKGQLFIIDLVRERFTPTKLASTVVDLVQRWRPSIVAIEDASGSQLLQPTIEAEALRRKNDYVLSACKAIDWFPVTNDKDAKLTRMAALHPMLIHEELFFVSHLPYLEILYSEFEKCLTHSRHDDIPDVIGQMRRYLSRLIALMPLSYVGSRNDAPVSNPAQAAWNLIFEENCDAFGRVGRGDNPAIPFVPVPIDTGLRAESGCPGLPSILGAGITG